MTTIKRYSELVGLETLDDRFKYLKIFGSRVGAATFGYERRLNQIFYASPEWHSVRDRVIIRDKGCNMGVDGYDIHGGLYVHHMNPICVADLVNGDPEVLLNPETLITVDHETHNAIHYGSVNSPRTIVTRSPNDTKLW